MLSVLIYITLTLVFFKGCEKLHKNLLWSKSHVVNNIWYGMVWYGMPGMVWYGMVWYGMVWYGMMWYDVV